MTKIVVLDGGTILQNDLDWAPLAQLGEVTAYDSTPPAQAAARIGMAEAVLASKVPLTADVMDACPRLRYIGVLATGYNMVDLEAAAARGITVTNIPAYSTAAVAQHIFALLLTMTNHVSLHAAAVRAGDWCRSTDFCFLAAPLTELAGKTMTIIGLGQIGRAAAGIARAFGMEVCAVVRRPAQTTPPDGVRLMPLVEGLQAADVLALCCPLTPDTERLLRAETLKFLKPSALVINTARGPLVDEKDLADALQKGQLAGYAADVVAQEPMRPDNPLLTAPRCLLTPHIAWSPRETRQRLIAIAAHNLSQFLSGGPVDNVIGACHFETSR